MEKHKFINNLLYQKQKLGQMENLLFKNMKVKQLKLLVRMEKKLVKDSSYIKILQQIMKKLHIKEY